MYKLMAIQYYMYTSVAIEDTGQSINAISFDLI